MKNIYLLLITCLVAFSAGSQQTVSLEDCYLWARENYPGLKQSGLLIEISQLTQENYQVSNLPVIHLNGQATYQSDVTKVEIPVPSITMPEIPKDQYKLYVEARQNIWDGGISRTLVKLEEAALKTGLSQLETELYQLKDQVNDAFFTALLLKNQQKIIDRQSEVLKEKLNQVESAIRNGVLEESNKWMIEAEILTLDQQRGKAEAGFHAAISVLSLITGKTMDNSVQLMYSDVMLLEDKLLARPELDLFKNRIDQLNARTYLLEKQRYPKIFGFGQAGYGRPGLNMLNTEFDSFYLVGIGLNWNIWDFRKTQREKQGIILQQQMLSAQEETFRRNISLLLARIKSSVDEISSAIEKDKKIAGLRKMVATATGSKLRNGTVTPADYLRDLNAETIALLSLENHKIQLEEAKIKYNTLKGN